MLTKHPIAIRDERTVNPVAPSGGPLRHRSVPGLPSAKMSGLVEDSRTVPAHRPNDGFARLAGDERRPDGTDRCVCIERPYQQVNRTRLRTRLMRRDHYKIEGLFFERPNRDVDRVTVSAVGLCNHSDVSRNRLYQTVEQWRILAIVDDHHPTRLDSASDDSFDRPQNHGKVAMVHHDRARALAQPGSYSPGFLVCCLKWLRRRSHARTHIERAAAIQQPSDTAEDQKVAERPGLAPRSVQTRTSNRP